VAINAQLGAAAVDPVRLRRAALLHDIGKLTVPSSILDKAGPLDRDERAIVERHATYTLTLLQRVPVFGELAEDAADHHEWIDGRGYARGLSGDALSTTARLLAVADVLDALTSNRPYQNAMPAERVKTILTSEAGTHFDPACVEACLGDVLEAAQGDQLTRLRHVA
jgi:HD-GYP domain-containing protein (c-di-GMP phosphodiesterase class II)